MNVNPQCTARRKSQPMVPLNAVEFSEMLPGYPSLQPITNLLFLLVTKLQLYSAQKAWLMHYLKLSTYNLMGHSILCRLNSISCEQFFVNIGRYTIPAIIGVVAGGGRGGQHMSRPPPPDFVPEAGICVEN